MRRYHLGHSIKTKGVYSAVVGNPTNGGTGKATLKPHAHRRSHITNLLTETRNKTRTAFKGEPSEEPKVVATRSKWKATSICLVHIIPVMASIVLVAMNLKGFYIGSQLEGSAIPSLQAIYILCLQVTAKLVVR